MALITHAHRCGITTPSSEWNTAAAACIAKDSSAATTVMSTVQEGERPAARGARKRVGVRYPVRWLRAAEAAQLHRTHGGIR